VGAGTGSYEPDPRAKAVVAVEPSDVMLGQRSPRSAPAVRGRAEELPFADRSFDVALAVLTVHHWEDQRSGIDELRRVAPSQVVVTFDPSVHNQQWIVSDYLPEMAALARTSLPFTEVVRLLDADVATLPMTRQFADGVLGAFWCRPHAYLDPAVRSHMSGFALLDRPLVEARMARLAEDLQDGTWERRHPELTRAATYDAGFRPLVHHRS